jgi:hypothetical protein
MSHFENQDPDSLRICVSPGYATSRSSELGAETAEKAHQIGESHPAAGVPITRAPGDPWHCEAYLIACLVKTHGWRVIEPGLIRRMDGLERSVTLPSNRAAGREQLRQLRGAA